MNTLQINKFLLLFVIGILVSTTACTKQEKLVYASKPIEIKTLSAADISTETVTLCAEITHLNEESVLEYGFIFYRGLEDSLIIKKQDKAKPGLYTFDYRPGYSFEIYGVYGYRAYLKTDLNTYRGNPVTFSKTNLALEDYGTIQAILGEQISLKGDFSELTKDYDIWLGYPFQKSIDYTISIDKATLSFNMPPDIQQYEYYDANPISLEVRKEELAIHRFGSIQLLPILLPPAHGIHYFSDPITLTVKGLPRYIETDFRVIIGDKLFTYQSSFNPYSLGLTGCEYRIGYYNGRDTVIFDEPWRLKRPDAGAIEFSPKIVHPKTETTISGIDFYKYFVYNIEETSINGISTFSSSGYQNISDREVYIPDLPTGKYTLSLKSPMYPTLVTTNTIEVRELKISHVALGEGYFNDQAFVKGNFIPGQDYVVMIGDREAFNGKATQDELHFELPFMELGTFPIAIGYLIPGMNFHVVDKKHTIKMKGGTIDSFYPKKGLPGDIVTIKGKGLRSSHFGFSVGNTEATIVSRKEGEVQIIVPNTNRKGLQRIAMGAFDDWIFATDYFEVL